MNEILIQFVLPLITLVVGWLTSSYRNKQKKENDVLNNVQQAVEILKDSLNFQADNNERLRLMLNRLEKKYEHKASSIRKAYNCKVPSEDCPVLINESKIKTHHDCDECEHNPNNCGQ